MFHCCTALLVHMFSYFTWCVTEYSRLIADNDHIFSLREVTGIGLTCICIQLFTRHYQNTLQERLIILTSFCSKLIEVYVSYGLPRSLNKVIDDRDLINSWSRSLIAALCLAGDDRKGSGQHNTIHRHRACCCCNWLTTPHLPPLPIHILFVCSSKLYAAAVTSDTQAVRCCVGWCKLSPMLLLGSWLRSVLFLIECHRRV